MENSYKPTTLRALSSLAQFLESKLIESGGEITQELEKEIELTTDNLLSKIDAYSLVKTKMEKSIEYHKQMMKNHAQIINEIERSLEWLEGNLRRCMEDNEKDFLKGHEYLIKKRLNPPSCEILDEDIIPEEFKTQKTVTSIDKKKILEGLKLGIQVPGARLVQGSRLEIKTRIDIIEDSKQ
jgi:hypothetical protein